MHSIRRILVAVKDPQGKSLAVAKAAQLACALGASLELFHSLSSPLFVDAYAIDNARPDIERDICERCAADLERIAASLRSDGLKVSVSTRWDYPAYEAVIRHAQRVQADLIVAERHPTRHILPGLLHFSDWELLRLSPVPVLLVKTGGTYRRPTVLAAIDPTHAFSKPTRLDAQILEASSTMAAALRGTLHAVHAYIPVPALAPSGVSTDTVRVIAARAADDAKRLFEQALAKSGIPHKYRHLVARHPIDAIGDTARAIHSDIVVMGAISRSGLKRLMIGNTAENVLDSLTCDVLIVKPQTFVSKVRATPRGVRYAASALVQGPY